MTRITRRTFVETTATLAGAGVLANVARPFAQPTPAAPALPTRAFGRTGVQVTLVGFGGGSRFYEPVADDEAGAELVRQAIERGVGLIETAANYGPGSLSEKRIGLAMKTHRSRVFLETKIDARDYDGAMRELERSLTLLQTDRLDLVLHHFMRSTREVDRVLAPDGAEKAIRKFVDQKVIRFHGFSTHVPAVALDAMDRLDADAFQAPINATGVPDFEAAVLPKAQQKEVAVIAMKTCGHGYFQKTNTTRPDRQDQFGAPPSAFATPHVPQPRDFLHYALSLPIATAVVGMDSLPTIEQIVAAARAFQPLAPSAMTALTRRAQVFATTGYWING